MSESLRNRRMLSLAAAPLAGWLTLVFLPEALPKGPDPAGLAATALVFAAAAAAAFALGYLQPRWWLLLGVLFAAPMTLNGIAHIYRQQGNLWPLALFAVGEMLVLAVALSFGGRAFRAHRRAKTSPTPR